MPRIGNELAVEVTIDVELGEALGQLVQRDRGGSEARGQLLAALERPVGDGDRLRVPGGEVRGGEIDHLAGADQQQVLVGERRVDALGELDRRRGHRNRRAADVGVASHVLRHRERALEKAVEDQAQSARRFGAAHRLLHLAENLRLAEHHRIEPAGDAKGVRDRAILRQRVDIRMERLGGHPVEALQPALDRRGFGGAEIDLGPVAGRQNRRFLDARLRDQVAQRDTQRVRLECNLLAHLDRRGRMVQAKGVERHVIDRK